MEIVGILATLCIGFVLGALGGGGSILTVPILVYLWGFGPTTAITYSLFIVGTTSIAGAWVYFKNKWFDLPTAFWFGIPSSISVLVSRQWLLPAFPSEFMLWNGRMLEKGTLLLILFACLMVITGILLLRKTTQIKHTALEPTSWTASVVVALQGLGVGLVTGLLGAGGGFLILPALVTWRKLPMKIAVGTSLSIIAFNSLLGFAIQDFKQPMDWTFLGGITAIAVVGMMIGMKWSKNISNEKLKTAFAFLVVATGVFVWMKEIFV